MSETFRYVDSGYQDPLVSNTQMPIIGREVAEGGGPVMTTGVVGRTHLNVGWFDDVDATLDLDRCRELGIQVIRRPVYGGGTAFYEAGSAVMWSWLLPKDTYPDLDAERALLAADLENAGMVDAKYQVTGIGPTMAGRNGGGHFHHLACASSDLVRFVCSI